MRLKLKPRAVRLAVDDAVWADVNRAVREAVSAAVSADVRGAVQIPVRRAVDGAVDRAVCGDHPHPNLDLFLTEVRRTQGSTA